MKDILIVVDMQKGFVKDEQTIEAARKIADLLDRKVFDCVIATRFLNDGWSIYEKLFNWYELESAEEQEIVPEIEKHVDYTFDKYIYDCVNASFIQKLCQVNDGVYPEEVYVIGVDTDCCVLSIATSLFENNIRPVVLSQYCASSGGTESHKAGLLCMKRLISEKQVVDKEIHSKADLVEQ